MRRNYHPAFWLTYVRTLRTELRDLPRFLRENRIALVHLNMHVSMGPTIAAHRLSLPIVVHYRAKTNDRPAIFFDLFLPWLHRRAAEVVCISEAVANHFVRRGLAKNVTVIPNPVDLARFLDTPDENPLSHSPNLRGKRIILYVGRIHPQKRIHLLLDAVERLSRNRNDIACVVVGDAAEDRADQDYFDAQKKRSSTLGCPVEWFARCPDVSPFMHAADVLVLPSVNEGFGRVLVEGMAAGVPLVGADSGGIPEILDGGRWGQLFEPDRSDALAEALARALDDPAWQGTAKEAVTHASETFSIDRHAGRIMEIYDRHLR
jgi:glycosyltransferase involved in cell wall biosynthesis